MSPPLPRPLRQAAELGRYAWALQREQAAQWWSGRVRGDLLSRAHLREGRRDPYPVYEALRARGDLVPTRLGNLVTASHAVSNEVLRSRRFGVAPLDPVEAPAAASGADLSFLQLDPPDHTRLRRLAAPAFSPRMMASYEAMVQDRVVTLLDDARARGRFDLVGDLAAPLPVGVISTMMGVDDADASALQRYGAALASALDGVRSLPHLREVMAASAALESRFAGLVERRRTDPQDDLVSVLVAELGEGSDGAALRAEEILPMCTLLLVAGFETTVNLIGSAVLALQRHPDQWQALVDDPSLASAVVEETLRWDPPVHETARVAREDVELAGRTVRRGQWVVLLLAATGRDPRVYADPARFDVHRTPGAEHLAFSSGLHYCVGASLARLEATVALRELAVRVPGLRLDGRVVRRPTTTIRGPVRVPVAVGG